MLCHLQYVLWDAVSITIVGKRKIIADNQMSILKPINMYFFYLEKCINVLITGKCRAII